MSGLRWNKKESLFEGECSDGRHIAVDATEVIAAYSIDGGMDFQDFQRDLLNEAPPSHEFLDPDLWQRLIENGDSRRGKTIFYQEQKGGD